ncbi:MAG: PAS domain-containing protein [Deltaproteobacteria bacterium]|nr:PAS domain-containing protein [Deltaproteobacteria bacterium]
MTRRLAPTGRPKRVRVGLRLRIMGVFALVAVAPTLLLGGLAIRSARHDVQDEVLRGHLALIRAIGQQLNARLQDTRRSLVVAASAWVSLREQGMTSRPTTRPGRDQASGMSRVLRRLRAELPLLDGVSAIDHDGHVVAGDVWPASVAFEIDSASTYGGYVSAIHIDGGKKRILMVVQVRNRRGELFGFIAGIVDLAFVRRGLAKTRLGHGASLLVVDGAGRPIASSGPLPKARHAASRRRQNPAIDRMLAQHTEGSITWHDGSGAPWISVYRNIAGMNEFRGVRWGVLMQQPTRDAYALAEETTRHTIIVALVVLLVALVAGAALARRLTRPLARLVRQTERVAAGDLDIPLEPEDGRRIDDELGQLAKSFASMVRDLRGDRDRLYAMTEFRENLVRSLPVGLISIERDQRIVTINPAQEVLSEVAAEDVIGLRLGEVFGEALDDARLFARLERVLASGGTVDVTLDKTHVPFTSRRPLRYRVWITPLRDRQGDVDGAVILQEDLSDRARLEEQLLRSEKLSSVGVLAAGVAHEINNPLTTILGYAKLLLEGRSKEDEDHDALDLVAEEAQRVQHIVRNLLDFSRRESGEKAPTSIIELVERTLSLVAPDLRKRGVVVTRDLNRDVPMVLVEARRIEQVLVNLLTNAGHAMPDGGTLTVRIGLIMDVTPPRVFIEITDTGEGISKRDLGRIFDPFFTTKEPGKGTGLGLSVSHGIIVDHGGKIDVESEIGSGTTFRIILPGVDIDDDSDPTG